jgi:hypothetical protein
MCDYFCVIPLFGKCRLSGRYLFGSEMRAVDVLYPMNYVDMMFNDLHIFDDVMFLHSDFECKTPHSGLTYVGQQCEHLASRGVLSSPT